MEVKHTDITVQVIPNTTDTNQDPCFKIVNLGKFSYISKFHIIISCKLIVYIVMCFYQETN